MAVQFKVPKSPKRDIAISDTFMGVDLTNTGANIDGYRSPHAPNMVRNVPGKVRKRMGYYKEVLFGTDENVNFAWGTSAQEKEIHISSDDTSTWVKVYDLIQTISSDAAYTLYLEFDYKSEADFNIMNATTIVTASEDWEHISTSVECLSTDTFSDVKIFSEDAQNIYIKNFALLKTRTESYEWSPAPKYFVERETNDSVYGVHFLRKPDNFEGDRISNVDRVLEINEEPLNNENYRKTVVARLAEVPDTNQTYRIYLSGRAVWEGHSGGYDHLCQANVYIGDKFLGILQMVGGYDDMAGSLLVTNHPSFDSDEIKVEEGSISVDGSYAYGGFSLYITYARFEYYKTGTTNPRTPTPELSGDEFHYDEAYDIYQKNYSTAEVIERDSTSFSTTYSFTETIGSASDHITDGGSYLYFEITTTTTADRLTGITVEILDNSSNRVAWSTSDKHYKKKKYHFFIPELSDDAYVKSIKVTFTVSGSTKAHLYLGKVSLKKYELRESFYTTYKYFLYHVGKDFYLHAHGTSDFNIVYSEANEHISQSFQINENSYIIDGKNFYEFSIKDGERVVVVDQENAYIPTVTKAREYNGGGVGYEAFNLLQPGFIEQFIGVANERTYQLSQNDLDDTPVKAWLLDSNGNWNPKEEDTDFSVDRNTGKVTFVTAPGVTPLEGEDSIRIQAYKTFDDYRDRIVKCQFGTLYGVSGAADRIFLSGNPEHPNWDFYSQYKNAAYFPDTGYSVLGSSQSAITGYAVVSNYLATFKDGFDQSQSVFVREGDMLVVDEENKTSEPVFKLINSLQGVGSISPYSFGYLQTEPVFLTKAGIYAITEQDITGEKYSQNRSFYLDGQLRKEDNLGTAFAVVHDNQYILALNGKLYVLDGLQATRTDKSEPYATRQYAGFLCTDIPALTMWEDEAVCFGTNDGKVCRFYTDVEALESYNDDGKPIYSCWETPDLDGKLFYKNKTFRYMAVRLMQAVKTSVKLYSRRFGLWTLNAETAWNLIKEQTTISNMLDFENLDFNLFSFSADLSERLVHTKLRVKKVDKARFRVENGELNEPFGLFDLALEYIESGNYKG